MQIKVIDQQIHNMKKQLQRTAKRCEYDLQHPNVISLSQELDRLIVSVMAEQQNKKHHQNLNK